MRDRRIHTKIILRPDLIQIMFPVIQTTDVLKHYIIQSHYHCFIVAI